MAYATLRHSCALRPPSICTVMNLVAPSPSRTMACASLTATSSMVAFKALPACESNDSIGTLPALLEAMSTNESFVEVSPSTVTRLNEPSANSSASCCITPWFMLASVAIKPSIVAMLGRIMPAPLLTPVMLINLPSSMNWAPKALGTVSVVMIPSAARSQ